MIYLKTDDEIELLRKANLLVSATLTEIAKIIRPGITTLQMDSLAEQFIRDNGAVPTFKGFLILMVLHFLHQFVHLLMM